MPYKDKEKRKEYDRKYKAKEYATEEGAKKHRMMQWIYCGINNVNDDLYNTWLNCKNCNSCNKILTDTKNKTLDHDHETGEFRQILCRECNTNDSWKYKTGLKEYVSKEHIMDLRGKNNTQYECECGAIITKYSLPRHKGTKKHKDFLSQHNL